MRIQYKHQKFQADAAKAVVDVFAGQPYLTPTYMMDRGTSNNNVQYNIADYVDFTGWSNQKIAPELNDQLILEHLQKIQRANQIAPSSKLGGCQIWSAVPGGAMGRDHAGHYLWH